MSEMRSTDERADPRWSCVRKKAYTDERMAKKVAGRIRHEKLVDVVAYACTHCGWWHIGHRGRR